MSDKRTKMRQRRQGYRLHHRRLRGEKRGVSPVVATLILILIAVAAAAALYLWLVVWQGNLTKTIGTTGPQATLTIAGSTSVYPFSSLGVTWFEQNNTDVVISDNQGGTGAGMVAVCSGNVNIGAASLPVTVSLLEDDYGCAPQYASTTVVTTIAYDSVDVIVSSTNNHGLLSMNFDTLNVIYEAGSTSYPSAFIGQIDDVPATSYVTAAPGFIPTSTLYASSSAWPSGGPGILWDEIPAAVQGASFTGLTVATTHTITGIPATGATVTETQDPIAIGSASGWTACASSGTYANDICDAAITTAAATAASGTPCGFLVCAGPLGTTASILPVERFDASGTTQTFEAKVLGYSSGPNSYAKAWGQSSGSGVYEAPAGDFAALGYGGCGGNNLLSDCGFAYPTSQQGTGNPGVISDVAGGVNAIGYASDGLARASGSGVSIVPFLGMGEDSAANGLGGGAGSTLVYGGVLPTTGTTGTIAAGLIDSSTINQYVGGRPFDLVSLEPLTGVAQEFVTFLTDPAVNAALASATEEVGLYSVVP